VSGDKPHPGRRVDLDECTPGCTGTTPSETRFRELQKGQSNNVTENVESGVSRKNVETRASGRPPEEAESDNPEEQARAILEDSEDRKNTRADLSQVDGDS
jgi:hypothetical protein